MSQTIVPIKQVHPDADQPRKHFDAFELTMLTKSIEKHGIINPITVEQTGKDEYLIVDGERRYRAAVKLGLEEIPVNIKETTDEVTRIVEQFHIQEMHQDWSPMEKASVIENLSEKTKRPFMDVCSLLGIKKDTARRYIALTKLTARDEFSESNVNMQYADAMNNVTGFVKVLMRDELEENFTLTEKKKLEKMILKNIVEGTFESTRDVTRLKDTFKANPKMISKFLEGADANELFIKSKAKGAYHLRNAINNANYTATHVRAFLAHPEGCKVKESDVRKLQIAQDEISKLLKSFEE